MINLGIHNNWIIYQARDGVVELWCNKGANAVSRVVTTATNLKEAMEWIDGMGKKGKKVKIAGELILASTMILSKHK